MRAAVQVGYGAIADSIRLGEVPTPTAGDGQVLVRVEGSTINRKDLFALRNLTGPGIRARPPLPHVSGADCLGTIAAIGAGVTGWTEGDRVVVYPGLYCGECEYCLRGQTTACVAFGVLGEQAWGSHAEYVLVDARNLERVPRDVPPERLVCVSASWLTAWHALVTVAAIRPGEDVLIVGASGGVGTAAIQIVRLAGCRPIAAVGSAWKRQRALESGAASAIDYGSDDFQGRARLLTGGRGVDVVLDSVGADTWRQSINALAPFGRMVVCGATSGDNPEISVRELYQQHRRILGGPLGSRGEFRELLRVVIDGKLKPIVHQSFPLDRIHEALRVLESREFFGKIVINV